MHHRLLQQVRELSTHLALEDVFHVETSLGSTVAKRTNVGQVPTTSTCFRHDDSDLTFYPSMTSPSSSGGKLHLAATIDLLEATCLKMFLNK